MALPHLQLFFFPEFFCSVSFDSVRILEGNSSNLTTKSVNFISLCLGLNGQVSEGLKVLLITCEAKKNSCKKIRQIEVESEKYFTWSLRTLFPLIITCDDRLLDALGGCCNLI